MPDHSGLKKVPRAQVVWVPQDQLASCSGPTCGRRNGDAEGRSIAAAFLPAPGGRQVGRGRPLLLCYLHASSKRELGGEHAGQGTPLGQAGRQAGACHFPLAPRRLPPLRLLGLVCTQVRWTLLHSHGNAVDIGEMLPLYEELASLLKVNVMCYDYTGCGGRVHARLWVAVHVSVSSAVFYFMIGHTYRLGTSVYSQSPLWRHGCPLMAALAEGCKA